MWAMLCAVGAGLCWGVGEVFTKVVLHSKEVGPLTVVAVRTVIALPILIAVQQVAVRVSPVEPADWVSRMGSGTWARLALGSGLLAGAAALALFYTALSLGEISRVKPVSFAIAPATAALLAFVFLGEAVTARKVIGIALVVAGVIALAGAPGKAA